jgi:hypothetical protein
MTQRELDNLIEQINQAFKTHFDRLEELETKVEALINEQEKGSTASKSRGKRVQQAKEDA